MSDLPIVSHQTALQGYWWQLEQTPHQRIAPSVMAYTGRASILRHEFVRTNGIFTFGTGVCFAMNWVELGVVPVGGQGLTPQERTFCALAGRAMVKIFEEEARANGNV